MVHRNVNNAGGSAFDAGERDFSSIFAFIHFVFIPMQLASIQCVVEMKLQGLFEEFGLNEEQGESIDLL